MANVKDLLVNGSARVIGTIYGNATSANKLNTNAGSASQPVYFSNGVPVAITSYSGNAATATKLATARTIQTNLASTAPASFDGSANITPGVTGILPIANGGTGQNDLSKVSVGNADKVDNYHVNDHGYVYKYTREVICTTTLKD